MGVSRAGVLKTSPPVFAFVGPARGTADGTFAQSKSPPSVTVCGLGQQRVEMTLWTFCQSVLLTFNAFAILNEQRFLDKYGLGQGAVNAGYVPSGSARGQLIGVITATQYGRVPLVVLNVLVIFVKMVFG